MVDLLNKAYAKVWVTIMVNNTFTVVNDLYSNMVKYVCVNGRQVQAPTNL